MPSVNFYLKTKQNDTSLVYMRFRYHGKMCNWSFGHRVPVKFWDSDKQRLKRTRSYPQWSEFNALLDEIEHFAKTTYFDYIKNGTVIDPKKLRQELDEHFGLAEKEKTPTLLEFVKQFIKERDESPKYKKGSIQVYRSVQKHLTGHAKANGIDPEFEDIDLEYLNSFRDYLLDLEFSGNYVHKIISTLRTFLNEATERKINTNLAYKSKYFKVKKERVQKVYLTLEQLDKLYRYDFSDKPRLERVRDLFLVGCFTGLRFSDFTNIQPENIRKIDGVECIEITTQKTSERVVIPLHPYVRAIIDKHDGKLPRGISNQRMNDYIKEAGKLAGINERMLFTRSAGGEKITEAFEKWEKLSTHCARRSFATNAFKAGLPTLAIMKITGHKTETAFMRYIQITKEENAVLMANSEFFRPKLKAVK